MSRQTKLLAGVLYRKVFSLSSKKVSWGRPEFEMIRGKDLPAVIIASAVILCNTLHPRRSNLSMLVYNRTILTVSFPVEELWSLTIKQYDVPAW